MTDLKIQEEGKERHADPTEVENRCQGEARPMEELSNEKEETVQATDFADTINTMEELEV